jgi:hypothetical protein
MARQICSPRPNITWSMRVKRRACRYFYPHTYSLSSQFEVPWAAPRPGRSGAGPQGPRRPKIVTVTITKVNDIDRRYLFLLPPHFSSFSRDGKQRRSVTPADLIQVPSRIGQWRERQRQTRLWRHDDPYHAQCFRASGTEDAT